MARAATVSKLIVPHFSSTVSAACSAPGTTAGSSPAPWSVLPRERYQFDVHGLRRPALADHRRDLLLAHRIDQHEAFPAEAVEILLDDAADEQRRHAGIEGVAALVQDLERGRRHERMPRRHTAIRSRHQWPEGGGRRGAAHRRFGIGPRCCPAAATPRAPAARATMTSERADLMRDLPETSGQSVDRAPPGGGSWSRQSVSVGSTCRSRCHRM